jgi:hypothetical protein
MDWSDFSFGGATGLSVVVKPGQPDPHWWPKREVDVQHCKGSDRNVITNLGLGVEKLTCTVHLHGEDNYNAFLRAGKRSLDGRSVLAVVQGMPETYYDDGQLEAYIPVEFLAV